MGLMGGIVEIPPFFMGKNLEKTFLEQL